MCPPSTLPTSTWKSSSKQQGRASLPASSHFALFPTLPPNHPQEVRVLEGIQVSHGELDWGAFKRGRGSSWQRGEKKLSE